MAGTSPAMTAVGVDAQYPLAVMPAKAGIQRFLD